MSGGALIAVEGLTRRFGGLVAVKGVDLAVSPGEIVGVTGIGGNGQDELVACAAGLAPSLHGAIAFGGEDLTGASSSRFRAVGIGYLSADRAQEGLCLSASLRDNFVAGRECNPAYSRFGVLRLAEIGTAARRALSRLSVRYGALADPAASLSGGNQQRLAIARELEREPRLLVAAQPTRGVDIAGTAFIHRLIAAFRDRGGAVLLVSEALDEILALSDRIVCLYNGRIVGELSRAEANVERVGHLMLGQTAAGRQSRC